MITRIIDDNNNNIDQNDFHDNYDTPYLIITMTIMIRTIVIITLIKIIKTIIEISIIVVVKTTKIVIPIKIITIIIINDNNNNNNNNER